jgi:ribonuclease VapC
MPRQRQKTRAMQCVFDSSAILAAMLGEPGGEVAAEHLSNNHMLTVNLSEVIMKLIARGMKPEAAYHQCNRIDLTFHNFTPDLAFETAVLRKTTQSFGLSLGDRACVALGKSLGLPILTSDRRLASAGEMLDHDIRMIR